MGKSNYRAAILEQNLRMSQFWLFIEEVHQGIHAPPLDLVLPILCLRHAIYVVFGASDLQPLTIVSCRLQRRL